MLEITLKHTMTFQDIKEEGREEATVALIIRQLTKRFGEVPAQMRASISSLPLPVLEELSEALLNFTSLADLQPWLEARLRVAQRPERLHNTDIAQSND
ncbi:DUF4351 domain-containing protein [Gloeocapsa sp. BRSZ]